MQVRRNSNIERTFVFFLWLFPMTFAKTQILVYGIMKFLLNPSNAVALKVNIISDAFDFTSQNAGVNIKFDFCMIPLVL